MSTDGPDGAKLACEKPERAPLADDAQLADEALAGLAGGAPCGVGDYPGPRIEPQ